MIKFSQKNVEKSDILNLIDDELLNIEVSLTYQKKLNDQVLSYLKAFMNENPFTSDYDNINVISEYLSNTSKVLKKSSSNVSKYTTLQTKLLSLKDTINSMEKPSLNFVKTQFDDYNKKYDETTEKTTTPTIEVQTFLAKCLQDDILKELLLKRELSKKTKQSEISAEQTEQKIEIPEKITEENNQIESESIVQNVSEEISKVKVEVEPQPQTIENNSVEVNSKSESIDSETSNITENTLIISEKNGNVVLPYTIEELNEILKKNSSKYKNIEEIIEKKYTKPIKYYKNSSKARFKETFKLVKERSKGSFKHALDLAIEAFFNSDLHPAIISACKSVDELDIYLSCLEYDELEDFRFFKIVFDVLPSIIKKKKIIA